MCQAHSEGALFVEAQLASWGERSWSWMWRLPCLSPPVRLEGAGNDETTALQLFHVLKSKGHALSLRMILRCRTVLGWTFRGSSYCQLIRQQNKAKWLDWARQHLGESFEDVMWTDECTYQLETNRRFCCRKKGEPVKNKPRYICITSTLYSGFNHPSQPLFASVHCYTTPLQLHV